MNTKDLKTWEEIEADILTFCTQGRYENLQKERRAIIEDVIHAWDKWRVTLPSNRGFNHSEGMAFMKILNEILEQEPKK